MEFISTRWAIKSRQHCIMVIIPTNTRREQSGLNGIWIVVDRSQLLQQSNCTPDAVTLLP